MDIPVTKVDSDLALNDEEKIIRVRMRMLVELTLDLNDHNVVPIEIGDDSR